MPPKKVVGAVAANGRKKAAKAYQMAPLVAEGTILSDSKKQQFRLGKAFAQGGFGRIYTAKQIDTGHGAKKDTLVVKMEPAENGPLFQETHVYMRIAKPEMLEEWRKKNKVAFLGIPPYLSSGVQEIGREKHRFLIMPRYGIDLESIRVREGGKLSPQSVFAASRACSDALRYMHDQNYVHADLKAENLLLADNEDFSRVVLVDFGLAKRVLDPVYKEDKKRAHDGTCIFTSLDAHRGCVPSYRGDFEILAYNMLYWLSGSLPWMKEGEKPEKVQEMKQAFSKSVEGSVKKLVSGSFGKELMELFDYVFLLDYAERPDCAFVNKVLDSGAKKARKDSPVKQRAESQSSSSASAPRERKTRKESPVKQRADSQSSSSPPTPQERKTRKDPPLKQRAESKSSPSASAPRERKAPVASPLKKTLTPVLAKKPKKIAKKRISSSSRSPSPEPEPSRMSIKRPRGAEVQAESPDVVLPTPSPTDDRRTSGARRFIQKTPLHLARPPVVRATNGKHSPSSTASPIRPGLANMNTGGRQRNGVGAAGSPSTAVLSVIPGLANMRRVRRSIGASLVKKYIEKDQKKKKLAAVANGASQTSPGMW